MRIVVVGSSGYWGSRLTRVFREAGHDVVGEINLPLSGAIEITRFAGAADAAVVATPPASHFVIARAALAAGLDVLVEKPLAMSFAMADELRAVAANAGRVVSVDSTFVHTGIFAHLKARCGRIVRFQSLRLADGPAHVTVPALWDLAVHDVAILDALGLDPEPIAASQAPDGSFAALSVALNTGGIATIFVSRSWHSKIRQIEIGYDDGSSLIWDGDSLRRRDGGIEASEGVEPLRNLVEDFARRSAGGMVDGKTDAVHGARVCAVLDRADGLRRAA